MANNCGDNLNGQLLLSCGPSKNFYPTPVETTITSGASFAIAGFDVSAVFIGEVPQNTPNRSLCTNHYNNKSKNQNQNSSTTTSSQPMKLEKNQGSPSKVKDTTKKEDNTSKGEFDKKEKKKSDNTLDENDAGIKEIIDAFKGIQDAFDDAT